MLLQILSLIIIGLFAIVVLIDIVPMCKDWLGRIHIGRYTDKQIWCDSISKVGLTWLHHTPKIKVTDYTRFTVIDRMRGNYASDSIQHWQEAALILGLTESLKDSHSEDVKNQIVKYVDTQFDETGQWRNKPQTIDVAILSYAIIKLDFIDIHQYKPAFDYTWQLIQDHLGEDGTVGYRKFMADYRYVDTIGFICPFLVAYGLTYDQEACIDLAVKQISAYEKHGMLNDCYIPSHAYSVEGRLPLGLYGWGRGLGWFAIGLIDAWNELPEGHRYKRDLQGKVKSFSKAIVRFQREDGSWTWTVTRKESRADSSTTATLSWFLLNAAKIAEISKDCLTSADQAIDYLMKVTRRNGAVDFSQGDTKDIGVYSMLFTPLPFTQGFCIRTINAYQKKAV